MTEQAKHTPGPWNEKYTKNDETELAVLSPSGTVIAVFGPNIDYEVQEANARLIAAAPELLEALKNAQRLLTKCGPITAEGLTVGQQISLALDKAGA